MLYAHRHSLVISFVNTNCKPDKDMNHTPIGIDPTKAFLDAKGGVHLRYNT
jgi:hypothetical protein